MADQDFIRDLSEQLSMRIVDLQKEVIESVLTMVNGKTNTEALTKKVEDTDKKQESSDTQLNNEEINNAIINQKTTDDILDNINRQGYGV